MGEQLSALLRVTLSQFRCQREAILHGPILQSAPQAPSGILLPSFPPLTPPHLLPLAFLHTSTPTGVLLPEELDWLLAQRHKPLALGQALSTIVEEAGLDPMAKLRLDGMLSSWTFDFGACNRTYNTAIPTAYTRLVTVEHGPLLLWCSLAP